jgi:cytochrome c5
MHSKNLIIGIALAIGVTGCAAVQLYVPTENDATASNVSLQNLQKGRELYSNSCASCHRLKDPIKLTKQEWETSMIKMQKKAKIDDKKKNLILQYVEAKCKPQ